ncbi:MAG: carboxypeptidase regulatory-like domain-containing protein [Bryobacterales bacterium]|nr:carboxypeptidase regulatory-like domain-containing protein [Bryobacterales bacterium]
MVLFLTLLTLVSPGWAVSWVWGDRPQVCEWVDGPDVVFRAKLLDGASAPNGRSFRYRAQVLEIFKGLPADTREVTLVTDAEERGNADLLIGTGFDSRLPGTFFYSHMFLSGRTLTSDDDPELVYLRQYAKGELPTTGWIEGRVVQNFDKSLSSTFYAPLPDVRVTVTMGDRSWRTHTAADGSYRVRDLPPGEFRVAFEKEGWDPMEVLRPDTRPLAAGRCARVYGSASTTASITFQVRGPDGMPAAKPVALWWKRPDGSLQWLAVPYREVSSQPGYYRFFPVPVADLVMGYGTGIPEPPQWLVPGTRDIAKARVFRLGRQEQVGGVVFETRAP